jgi:hypothetical protein
LPHLAAEKPPPLDKIEAYFSVIRSTLQAQNTFAVLPLPGAKLRDAGVRTPDFVVVGNSRAAIIEVDRLRHNAWTRKADDQDRDRH